MKSALIGWSGFVGNNLYAQYPFTHRYRSSDIEQIEGESFDLLVCAGAPAEKWKANQDPDTDRQNLQKLTKLLESVQAKTSVLISTIDVFGTPIDVDENTLILPNQATPYGRHRYELESFFRERFSGLIVRLPGLFGVGLKKNVIYDLLRQHRIEFIHPQGCFQYYYLKNLWRDIQIALDASLPLIHFATPPLTTSWIATEVFQTDLQPKSEPAARYDFHTIHAELYGKSNSKYILDLEEVQTQLKEFVAIARTGLLT